MRNFLMLILLTPAAALAEGSSGCPQLVQQTYREAYTSCQAIAARGQAPSMQSTPGSGPVANDLQCAMLLEETYRRGFRACQDDIDQRQRANREQQQQQLAQQVRVTGVRFVCEYTHYTGWANNIPTQGDVVRVTTYSNGRSDRVVVAYGRPARNYGMFQEKCEDIAARMNANGG